MDLQRSDDYKLVLQTLKERVAQAQYQALKAVNKELIGLYWDIGQIITEKQEQFGGPLFFVRVAGLEMHPLDSANRTELLKNELGIGFCNITKCCTEVCPEDIHITDNAIIPLKERVVDDFYDPLTRLWHKLRGR